MKGKRDDLNASWCSFNFDLICGIEIMQYHRIYEYEYSGGVFAC